MAFQKPNAETRPTLVGIGRLASFGSLNAPKYNETTGKTSTYYNEEVKIKGLGGMRDDKFRLLWRPEFFEASFNPGGLDRGASFVYKRHIASMDAPSMLEGLCGAQENFDILTAMFDKLADGPDPETIHAILANFFTELGPVPFVYVLQQERKVVGQDDEGANIRVATSYYEVESVMPITAANVKKLVSKANYAAKRATKALEDGKEAPAQYKFVADFSPFGIDVELPAAAAPAWV